LLFEIIPAIKRLWINLISL